MASPVARTPGVEGIDQWFDSFQQYETTLEEMAAASMDSKFKDELGAIEQWFKVLSEPERTASLYSLLQHSTQNQIKFFIAVLQQMSRSDPMTASMTPTTGISPMQLGQLNKTKPSHLSPLARSFTPGNTSAPANRNNLQFLSLPSPVDTPTSASINDSAATLAHQRQRLNALRAASNISVPSSAPILPAGEEGRSTWGPPERHPATIEEEKDSGMPTPSTGESTVVTPAEHESWSNMVVTPLVSMFPKGTSETGAANANADGKVPLWNAEGVVPQIGDAAIYRRVQRGAAKKKGTSGSGTGSTHGYSMSGAAPPMPTPAGVVPTTPYNLNMLSAMGVSPEAQLLAVQMFVNGIVPAGYVGPQPQSLPGQQQPLAGSRWRGQGSAGLKSGGSLKSAGMKSASSNGPASGVINRDHETDPELLKDVPAWLKALRLHKYAASFEGLSWKEMVVLDEAALETRGVVTVGARKRFIRLFETVRKSQGMEESVGTGEVEKEKEAVVEVEVVSASVAVAVS